jgi:hypothetical protein
VSHAAYIEVLAWHQPDDARSRTFLDADVARDLVQRMAAERLNSRKIRMFSPDSVYMSGRVMNPEVQAILDTLPMPPAEVANCKFVRPPMLKNPTLPHLESQNLLAAAPQWDWSAEPLQA